MLVLGLIVENGLPFDGRCSPALMVDVSLVGVQRIRGLVENMGLRQIANGLDPFGDFDNRDVVGKLGDGMRVWERGGGLHGCCDQVLCSMNNDANKVSNE